MWHLLLVLFPYFIDQLKIRICFIVFFQRVGLSLLVTHKAHEAASL